MFRKEKKITKKRIIILLHVYRKLLLTDVTATFSQTINIRGSFKNVNRNMTWKCVVKSWALIDYVVS